MDLHRHLTPSSVAATGSLVETRDLSKRFGGTTALASVDLVIQRGTVHALVGENGAGKSTLGKIMAGVVAPDSGQLLVAGREVRFRAPHDALAAGISMIAQELVLVPQLSVLDNVFLGVENSRLGFLRPAALRRRFEHLQQDVEFRLPPDVRVGSLSVADRQWVEIMRALVRSARLVVMDEPTAALTANESAKLFRLIRRLCAEGMTIVYVSHFLEEVLALADTITVLRDGHLVRTASAQDESEGSLVQGMTGRSLTKRFPKKETLPADSPVILSVTGLSRQPALHDVSLEIRAGEIVGIAGLVGSGQTALARCLFGVDRADSGEVKLSGQLLSIRAPHQAIKAGIALLPESRRDQGLLFERPVGENVSLPHLGKIARFGLVRRRAEARRTATLMGRLDIKVRSPSAPVRALSGGNQQKVLFAKWMQGEPSIFIADEPTRGVDIVAKSAIYEYIDGLARGGAAVLLISSEVEEIIGLAHRVLVMREGRIVAQLTGQQVTEEPIMRAVFGLEAAG